MIRLLQRQRAQGIECTTEMQDEHTVHSHITKNQQFKSGKTPKQTQRTITKNKRSINVDSVDAMMSSMD